MADQGFNTPLTGQANWDSGLGLNFQQLERGFYTTERIGQAVSTGQILGITSAGFLLPWNPNSSAPVYGMAYTAGNSGDTLTTLAWGIVRSLGINSAVFPGEFCFSNASGFITTTTLGQAIGIGMTGWGVLFNPERPQNLTGVAATALAALTDVNTNGVADSNILQWSNASSRWVPVAASSTTHRVQSVQISAVTNSTHLFTMSLGAGLFGWNRRVRLNGASLSLVELRFYRDSGRTDQQYQTLSGGISAVTSFNDRAGWPIDTDSGTIYGSCQVFSTAVGSDTLNIICDWQV